MNPYSDTAMQSAPCAVVLAAGLGSRLGGCAKAALEVDGRPLLERLVGAFREAGVDTIHVVLGPYREVLLPIAARCNALPLLHSLPSPTLADSQRLALQSHVSRNPGCDLMLVVTDLPLLHAAPVRALLSAWRERRPGIQALVPTVDGTPGHPVTLSWSAAVDISTQPHDFGIKNWMARHPEAVWRLPCSDRAHVADIDTPDDVARFGARVHLDSQKPGQVSDTLPFP